MATIGELTASLTHEIRNPVASIRGAMDEMRNNLDSPEMHAKLAEIAIRESDHLNELVTGFLDFARDPHKRHQKVDLRLQLGEVVKQLQWKHENTVKIELLLPEDPCEVMANPTQIKQIFTNICDNAVEAMEGKGTIRISMELPKEDGEVSAPRSLTIHIEDEGPGIEPDMVARIFEPFYTGKDRGVGMGLAICMRLVTAHNGTIQAASRPGKGTTFTIRLPLAPQT
jgi:signal transduction histidine kinase